MPDAYVHAGGVKAVSITIASLSALQLVGFNKNWYDLLPIAGGALVGLVINCDLDIDAGTLPIHQLERSAVVGWILGHLFTLYWTPYALLIHHRSLISHAPVFSTLLRILYLTPLAIATLWALNGIAASWFHIEIFPLLVANQAALKQIGIRALIGLIFADTTHFFLDWSHGAHGKDNRDELT